MDKIDIQILKALNNNSRISGAEIARKVHLSVPAVTERLRKLNKSGVIERYTVRFNRSMLDQNLMAYIHLWLDHIQATEIKNYVVGLPEVLECHHVAGDFDLLLKVIVKDTSDLERFLVKKIKSNKAVIRSSTTIIMNTYKEELNVRIE
ncbi:MAG: Lrp/AsnC family transcriptional regulator [Cyclobacteriaceae bacterium]|nr:Lrp/AsnC family transcriptional regulator [Cyclobacteriaceae bacterium]